MIVEAQQQLLWGKRGEFGSQRWPTASTTGWEQRDDPRGGRAGRLRDGDGLYLHAESSKLRAAPDCLRPNDR